MICRALPFSADTLQEDLNQPLLQFTALASLSSKGSDDGQLPKIESFSTLLAGGASQSLDLEINSAHFNEDTVPGLLYGTDRFLLCPATCTTNTTSLHAFAN